jgi:hypothetical protein
VNSFNAACARARCERAGRARPQCGRVWTAPRRPWSLGMRRRPPGLTDVRHAAGSAAAAPAEPWTPNVVMQPAEDDERHSEETNRDTDGAMQDGRAARAISLSPPAAAARDDVMLFTPPGAMLSQVSYPLSHPPAAAASAFSNTMVEPCMMALLQCLTVRDRVRVLTVARAWLLAVQRPHLWSTVQWDCGRSRGDATMILPCAWLRTCLGGLNARYLELGVLATSVPEMARLQHLELGWSEGGTTPTVTAPVLRSALQTLRLRSLKITDLHPLLSEAIFGAPADALERTTNDVATHPALWSWSSTLEQLRLIFFADHRTFISCIIRTMCGREWTSLKQLELSVYTAIDLTQEQLSALKSLLTASHLPVIAQFSVKLELDTTIEDDLTAVVHEAITRCLPMMTIVDFDITVRRVQEDGAPVVIRSRPAYPLHLTQLRLHALHDDTFTVARLAGSSLQVLQCEGVWTLSALELFQSLSSHSLPHLHSLTLTCTGEEGVYVDAGGEERNRTGEHQRVAELMRGMSALTQLHCWYPVSDDGDDSSGSSSSPPSSSSSFRWIEWIHLFPRLTHASLHTSFEYHPRTQLVDSIAQAPALEDLLLSGFSVENVKRLAQGWSARCQQAAAYANGVFHPSINGAPIAPPVLAPPPLHTLSLVLSTAPSYLPLSESVCFLASLPALKELTVERFFEEEEGGQEGEQEPEVQEEAEPAIGGGHAAADMDTAMMDDTEAHVHEEKELDSGDSDPHRAHEMLSFLSQLPLLASLKRLTIVDDRRLLTRELMEHWSRSFGQLQELQWNHSLHDTPILLQDLTPLLQLPLLHRLTLLDSPGDCLAAEKRLSASVAQMNRAGRQPTLEVNVSEEVWTRFTNTPEGVKLRYVSA